MNSVYKTMFDGFKAIQSMSDIPTNIKILMWGHVYGMVPGWKVIGITKAALEVFKYFDYKRPPGRGDYGVNRSHQYSRIETGRILFAKDDWEFDEFWEFVLSRDNIVLATAQENYSIQEEQIDYAVPEGYFEAQGFAYKVNKKEKEFLKGL
jgi:hypothetical protein